MGLKIQRDFLESGECYITLSYEEEKTEVKSCKHNVLVLDEEINVYICSECGIGFRKNSI